MKKLVITLAIIAVAPLVFAEWVSPVATSSASEWTEALKTAPTAHLQIVCAYSIRKTHNRQGQMV